MSNIVSDAIKKLQKGEYGQHRYVSYHAPRYTLLVDVLRGVIQPGARVLDIGCGAGASALYMRRAHGFEVVGLDLAAASLHSKSERIRGVGLVAASARRLPIATSSMDAVFAECSLSLMDARDEVLAECFRVLAAQGRLAITDMFARNPHALGNLRTIGDIRVSGMISCAELEAQLAQAGFLVEFWEDHTPALKQLLFRCLMKGSDLEQLWTQKCTTKEESGRVKEAMKHVRPGYFLLVASKRGHRNRFDER